MRSGTLLPMDLMLLPSCCQLSVAFAVNLLLASDQHILRRNAADGTVQANVVVMLDLTLHPTKRVVQRERCSRPNALAIERLVPALDFAV
jgi:hypothetical protein